MRATHRRAIKVNWDALATLKQKSLTTKAQRADIERHRKRVTVLLDLLADRPGRSKRSAGPRPVRVAKGQRTVPPQKGPVSTQKGPVSDNYYANPLDSK
jgi:hypothetical protein